MSSVSSFFDGRFLTRFFAISYLEWIVMVILDWKPFWGVAPLLRQLPASQRSASRCHSRLTRYSPHYFGRNHPILIMMECILYLSDYVADYLMTHTIGPRLINHIKFFSPCAFDLICKEDLLLEVAGITHSFFRMPLTKKRSRPA